MYWVSSVGLFCVGWGGWEGAKWGQEEGILVVGAAWGGGGVWMQLLSCIETSVPGLRSPDLTILLYP